MAEPTARERLIAKLGDGSAPAFPGAVALTCEECGAHITWTNPPPPPVPVRCVKHPAGGRLNAQGIIDPEGSA